MMFCRSLLFLLVSSVIADGQKCGRYSCHGDVGNLVAGRRVRVSSTCGKSGSEIFCEPGSSSCLSPQCRRCRSGRRGHEHPSSHMTDSVFFHPRTWWQSSNDVNEVTLTFDLETTFYFTHLIMVFRSPRPGAMTIERSTDYGQTWKIYQRYSRDCRRTFAMDDDDEVEGTKCTSRYSSSYPCQKGEVIYRVLNPLNLIEDPYSDEARHLLKMTNLRIHMWDPQLCESCTNRTITDPRLPRFRKTSASGDGKKATTTDLSRYYTRFALYDLIIRGTCFCNGHADTCVPLNKSGLEPVDREQDVVHGKCVCEHNTAGDHCGTCFPLYNDLPWKPGNGDTGAANPCKRCRCHGHASQCHFDFNLYVASGNRSGGVCENCQHNTMGRYCHTCKPGYFRRPDSEISDQDTCQECQCNRIGSVNSSVTIDGRDEDVVVGCDAISGQCRCKPGVGGKRCDRCSKGFWGFGDEGCSPCHCERCDQKSGVCLPDYGDDNITFVDSLPREDLSVGFDLTGVIDMFHPPLRDNSDFAPSLLDFDSHMLPSYSNEPFVVSRAEIETSREAATWHVPRVCRCKDRAVKGAADFCKMKYDYAVRVRVKAARDQEETTLSVVIRKVFHDNRVDIKKGKAVMYPESWTVMGCTCPFLKPGIDYLVIGHEDPVNGRLMINVESVVEIWWNRGKDWAKTVRKYFRKKC